MRNTKAVGDVTEAAVLAEFMRLGFPVCVPFGDNQRYDLVVRAGGRFLSVQCKTASKTANGCIRFNAHSGSFGPADSAPNRSRDYRGEVDLFAAYFPDTRQVYVLPVDDCPVTDVWLRLEPAKTGNRFGSWKAGDNARCNQYGVRMAEEHTLAAWAAQQG